MSRILIVEDDEALLRGLQFNLEHDGHQVFTANSLSTARAQLAAEPSIALVLLDLGLPDGEGTELLRELRRQYPSTKALILSARTTETDIVQGLKLGAEDYVRKPFGLAELLARIELILSRDAAEPDGHLPPSATRPQGDPSGPSHQIQLSHVKIDLAAHMAVGRDGKKQTLTPLEVDLLKHFLQAPGVAQDRQVLLQAVWGLNSRVTTRTLDTHLARLRRKIEADPRAPRHLITVHGLGYRLDL